MSAEFMESLIKDQQKTIQVLTETIEANSEKHSREIEKLNQTISNLQEQIGLLSTKLFGAKSEKSLNVTEGQLTLF